MYYFLFAYKLAFLFKIDLQYYWVRPGSHKWQSNMTTWAQQHKKDAFFLIYAYVIMFLHVLCHYVGLFTDNGDTNNVVSFLHLYDLAMMTLSVTEALLVMLVECCISVVWLMIIKKLIIFFFQNTVYYLNYICLWQHTSELKELIIVILDGSFVSFHVPFWSKDLSPLSSWWSSFKWSKQIIFCDVTAR